MTTGITIIGSGNMAWHLAPALEMSGFVINEIVARTKEKGLEIGQHLYNPTYLDTLDLSSSTSTFFIILVSDNAIASIASEIILPDGAMILHTSGSLPLSVLELTAADHIGVLYPLQTFSRLRKIKFSSVPLLIEANNAEALNKLNNLASLLSKSIQPVSSNERLHIHLAAVFASNFTNHLLHIADQIMNEHGLESNLLDHLIRETIDKALTYNPAKSQTGPAVRNDTETINRHLELLQFNPKLQELYQLISESIQDRASQNDQNVTD